MLMPEASPRSASLWDCIEFQTSNFCDLCLATTTTTLTRDRTDDDTDNPDNVFHHQEHWYATMKQKRKFSSLTLRTPRDENLC